MYHFISEDDDHFLFKSKTSKNVTKQLSRGSQNRIFYIDAEVWETHAFRSTIINCREETLITLGLVYPSG